MLICPMFNTRRGLVVAASSHLYGRKDYMELKNYFAILRRWGWIMLLCTALAGVTGYLYTSRQAPVYQSRSRYLIGPALTSSVTSNDLRASGQCCASQ